MKFKSLAIQGFRSFVHDQVILFNGDKHGFFLLSGDNQVEPQLGENGAGKSSVWEALVWVLFAKTSRGLKAKTITNWNRAELTSVQLEFEIGGVPYELNRTWNPNGLRLTTNAGKKKERTRNIEQEELEDLIGTSYEGFLHSTVLGQFGDYFPDLAPAERMRIVSSALSLDAWNKRAKEAASALAEQEKECYQQKSELEQTYASRRELKDTLLRLKEKRGSWRSEQKQTLAEIKEKLKELRREATAKRAEYEECVEQHKRLQSKHDDAQKVIIDLDKEIQGPLREAEWKAAEYARTIERKVNDAKRSLKDAKSLHATCEVCESDLSELHLLELQKSRREKLEQLQKQYEAAAQEEDRATAASKVVKDKRANSEAVLVRLEDEVHQAKRAREQVYNPLVQLESRIKSQEQTYSDAKKATNPHTEMVDGVEARIAKLTKRAARQRAALLEMRTRLKHLRPWPEWFKELRLWLLSGAVLELEVAANNALAMLGLTGWKVKCALEKVLGHGGSKQGLHVEIESPSSSGFVPWESWSGGETQRLRLALAAALSDVICARSGYQPSLEAWDEPTAHLSAVGIEDMLEFFALRARQRGRQVWLIDHRSLNSGVFTGEWRVTKESTGSKLSFAKSASAHPPETMRRNIAGEYRYGAPGFARKPSRPAMSKVRRRTARFLLGEQESS